MEKRKLKPLDQVEARLEEALEASPADFTEIAWIQTLRQRAGSAQSRPEIPSPAEAVPETTVLVRVRERRRFGYHRTGHGSTQELHDAVRHALAQARLHEPVNRWRACQEDPLPSLTKADLLDPELSQLEEEEAQGRLQGLLDRGERAQLDWTLAQIAVASSRGLRRQARVTSATLFVTSGRGAEAGTARGSARRVDLLDPAGLVEAARRRRSPGAVEDGPAEGAPVVLSPEAVATLLEEVAPFVLGPMAKESFFHEGGPRGGLRGGSASVEEPALRRHLSLVDDATEPTAFPFPFDLKGAAKSRLWIVQEGTVHPLPRGAGSPEDQLGPFAAGGGEVRASNLLLPAGSSTTEELLAQAGDGLWIGSFSRAECLSPQRLTLECRARGRRRIEKGKLGPALPDEPLRFDLADLLEGVRGLGGKLVRRAFMDGTLGGTAAPALLVERLP